MTLDESCSVKSIKISNKFLMNATILSIPIKHALQTCTHTHKEDKFYYCFYIALCLPSSSFKPWVPDLNLNKSLEPMHVRDSM